MARTKSSVSPVGAVGPLAPFAGDLRALLEGAGYRPTTIAQNMRAVARLDGLAVSSPSGPMVTGRIPAIVAAPEQDLGVAQWLEEDVQGSSRWSSSVSCSSA